MDRFASTLQAAQGYTPPTDNPLGASYGGLLSNFNASKFKLGATATPLNAFSVDQAGKAQAAQAQAEMDRKQKLSDLQDQAKLVEDAQNGKGYKQVQKEDGGYDFLDPLGNKISLHQYSTAVGKPPADVLSKSQNNIDIQYVNDYKNLKTLLNAISSGDQKKLESLAKAHPDLDKVIKSKTTPEELTKQFMAAYPNVYQNSGGAGGPVRNQGQPLYKAGPQPNFLQQLEDKVGNSGVGKFVSSLLGR